MLLDSYESATRNGDVASLRLSQDDFLEIIDYYGEIYDTAKLLNACECAFEQYSYSAEITERYVDALLRDGKTEQAQTVVEESPCPDSTMISLLHARICTCRNDFQGADEYFSAIEQFPGIAEYSDVVATLASDCINAKNFKSALRYYDFLQKHDACDSELYCDIAFCHDIAGNFGKAEFYYGKYLEAYPFEDAIWFDLGTLYAKHNLFEKAIDAFEYAIALNGNNAMALHNIAIVYLNLFKFGDALKYFEDFAIAEPDNPLAFAGIAESHIGLKNIRAARENFARALEINPQCSEAEFGMLCILAIESHLNGQNDTFISRLRKIMAIDPSWPHVLCNIYPELKEDATFMKLLLSTEKINNKKY